MISLAEFIQSVFVCLSSDSVKFGSVCILCDQFFSYCICTSSGSSFGNSNIGMTVVALMDYICSTSPSLAEDAQLTPLLRLGAGACAGIIAMSATYPMDMVRGRLTVQVSFGDLI